MEKLGGQNCILLLGAKIDTMANIGGQKCVYFFTTSHFFVGVMFFYLAKLHLRFSKLSVCIRQVV